MDLVRYMRLSEALEDPAAGFIKPEDVYGVLNDFLHKRAVRSTVDDVRKRLLAAGRTLERNTVKLNGLVDDPTALAKLNQLAGVKKVRGYWASQLLSIPLLRSALHQLEQAQTVHDAVLAMVRVIGAVEDQEAKVTAPYVPPVQGAKPVYHNIYKYLMAVAGWPNDAVQAFNVNLAFFGNKVVQRLAQQVRNGQRVNKAPRPLGW